MPYRAPLDHIRHCLNHMVGAEPLLATGAFPHLADGTAEAVLEEAARSFEEQITPSQLPGDLEGARLENGVVRTPDAYHRSYAAIRDGGWVGAGADPEFGGMGLPEFTVTPVKEILGSCCLSLSLCPLLTQGVILALECYGTDEQKAAWLPSLISGAWSGTMNLTEANAGSDVGALRTRAAPNGDGSWSVTGEKIFISWGDCDLTENVLHMVLARTPDSPSGTRGISLFLVPKFLPGETGAPGPRNSLRPLSLENKFGLHGSPTAAMSYEGATGWLLGEEHAGMACMFTTMNAARLGVGLQGVSVAEVACQLATEYALERKQGKTPEGDGPILGHADVRRMVLEMRVRTEAARAICYDLAQALDLAAAAPDPETRSAAAARAAFMTPVAKAFGSDTGCEVASLAFQIHGGAGYIESTGIAQLLRDVRITTIYEGTNGIQAMDLVGRKFAQDGGTIARLLLAESAATARAMSETDGALGAAGERLLRATETALQATDSLVAADAIDRQAGATAYLRMVSLVRGAHHHGKGALAVPGDADRAAMAAIFSERALPEVFGLAETALAGARSLYAVPTERIAA